MQERGKALLGHLWAHARPRLPNAGDKRLFKVVFELRFHQDIMSGTCFRVIGQIALAFKVIPS
jgi:hypothetical protein